MSDTRYARAITRALNDAMEADPSVIVMGEDIGAVGGPFGVTRGLQKSFGADRVRDTSISEAAIVGAAVGAAMTGLKPVVEIMFMDFTTFTMDALVNQAAKAHFMFGGQVSVPMVLRTPHGGGINAGPQHSQCLEAWFAHVPGLKVVCPSNPADAYGLMRAAIDDPNPVIFVENKVMYGTPGPLDDNPEPVEIGKARRVRAGSDVTLVAYGAMVAEATAAAEALSAEGVEAEIIDLRSLQPWDKDQVLASLSEIHRMVIVHEAGVEFGIGAEIAAFVADAGFDELDAPVLRVGAPHMPVPFSRDLEAEYRPNANKIADAVRRVMQ